jgi:hypothetical protein
MSMRLSPGVNGFCGDALPESTSVSSTWMVALASATAGLTLKLSTPLGTQTR